MNCGILALDEPTTNLDRDNVFSLAKALSRIIDARKGQDNFQLVIISHDEEFVNELALLSNAEYYYRVYKNESRQHSEVVRQEIRTLELS